MSHPWTALTRSRRVLTGVVAGLLTASVGVAQAPAASAQEAPRIIQLPRGFSPEDITAGIGHHFYVGSLATGAIYRGNFRTGRGHVFVRSADGPTTGLFLERRRQRPDRLWAAGGPTGQARVYNARTGRLLRTFHVADPASGTFISDVIVRGRTAYYTDAFLPQLFVIPLGRHDGRLPHQRAVRTVPLSGDVSYVADSFNLNGLAVRQHRLVSAQTVTGRFFRINPRTGSTHEIPVRNRAGERVTVDGADGIAQRGRRLFVAQNFPEKLATVILGKHLQRARLVDVRTNPALDIPSSVEVDGRNLFALNARFTTRATPTTRYQVVRVHR
jgi:hypothetical protein